MAFIRLKYFSFDRELYWRRTFAGGDTFCMDIDCITALALPFLFGKAWAAAAEVCATLAIIAGESNDCAVCCLVAKFA